MRILLVGALPPPVHGLSIANAKFHELASRQHKVRAVDAKGAVADARAVGDFGWGKVAGFLGVYLGLRHVPWCEVLYLTPGQTFLGVAKMAPFVLLARLCGRPVVCHLHGGALGAVYATLSGVRRTLFRSVMASCRRAIVLAPSLRANFTGLLPSQRVDVVPNFADQACFRVEDPIPAAFDQDRSLRILYLSNLIPSKGILSLLEAVGSLLDEGHPIELDVAGHAEPEIAERVRNLSRARPAVRWHGTVVGDAKVALLGRCDLLALPTTYPMEGQPICILEAMAAGLNVLATRHAAIPEIFEGDTAFLIDDGSTESVREGLRRCLREQASFPERSRRHRELALRRYTEEAFVDAVIGCLERARTRA